MTGFDPYHKWLGIVPREQPANHYRLLGLTLFEQDADVISAAADRQMSFVRQHANGPQARESQRLLNELANARLCLLTPAKRDEYDAELRANLAARDSAQAVAPAVEPPAEAEVAWTPNLVATNPARQGAQQRALKPKLSGPLVGGGLSAVVILIAIVAYVVLSPSKRKQQTSVAQEPATQQADAVPIETAAAKDAAPAQPARADASTAPRPSTPAPVVVPSVPVVPNGPVDLLANLDLQNDVVQGQWERSGDVLHVRSARSGDLIQFPAKVPGQYAFEFEVNPSAAAPGIMVGLKMGSALPYVLIDGGNGKISGLARIDTLSAGGGEAGRSDGPFLTPGRWSKVCCQVQQHGVVVLCDSKPLIAWRGDLSRLTTSPELRLKAADLLFLATEGRPVQFRSVVLRPLTESERFAPFPTIQMARQEVPTQPASVAQTPAASVSPRPMPTEPATAESSSREPAQATSGKPAPPAAEELQQARKDVRNVLKDEYAKGKTNDDKISLALVLFDHAKKTLNEPVSKYVLLDEARQAAASAGQAELVLKAIDELDAAFEIEAFGMKAESLAEAAKHLKDAEDRQAFVEATLKTVDDAVDADDFEHALKLGAIAQSASVKARDPELKKRVASRVTELKKLQKDWESLAEARQKLEASPDDAGANAQVGRYVCLLRGDWEHGLPMLAKGDDKKLAPLAERELADPVETDEQIKLADDWWNATLGESAAVKDRLQSHAAEWYSRALPQLTGVSKLRVEKRVASLEGKDRPKKSKKQAAQQPPALVGNPLMPVNPVMPAAPNNRPTDYDFERKFAQRLIDQRANTLNLRGERGTAGGPMRTLPDWPFYVEGFMALGDSNVSDDDLVDAQRLHGLSSIWIDTGKVTDRSVSRLARNGTLRSVRLGMNAQVTLNALQGCTELETLELAGNLDLSAIGALAAKMPRLNSLTLIPAASAPVNLAFLPKLPALQSLRLDKATLTDEMLDSIQRCPRLTRLSLISATFAVKDFRPKVVSANSLSLELMAASVSAAEFKIFAAVFPRMESLHLNGAKVDAGVWRELQSLSQLRVLQIPQTSITDNDLQYLPGTLRDLNVSYCAITGEGFRKRRAVFPELTGLALNSSELTDQGLQAALELTPALQRLFVGKTKISPAVFEQVAKLPFLNFVSMTDLEDSDACLEPLSKARSLRNIYGKFSPEAVAKFRQIRPDCNVR